MALSFFDTDGTLIIPGAAAKWEAAASTSGISTTGVVILVGEADAGPDFTSEADITQNYFGTRSKSAIVAKYGAGPLVDAYLASCAPSKDAQVRGAPSLVYMVKTNKGTVSQAALGAYATVQAKSAGALGNLISVAIAQGTGTQRIVTISRKADGITDVLKFGGDQVLSVTATQGASFTIAGTTLTSAGAGAGAVAALNIDLTQFKTLADLAAYISAQAGWTATTPPRFQQMKPTCMDTGTFTVVVGDPGSPAVVNKDAYDFVTQVNGSRLIQVSGTAPTAGLPAVTVKPVFLAGGARGSTANTDVQAALDQTGLIRGNFVVPLFSQDSADDIAAGGTASASSYDIASINAMLSDHVSKFSQFKRRKPRQGFASVRDTFANAKTAAQSMANLRVSMNFLDVSTLGQAGLGWFQPWMGATLAASMQAAGFYRPLFNKAIAVYGVRQNAADFAPADDDAVEDALSSGLMVIRQRDDGAFAFSSDNTTYGADENIFYNSIQAIYVADTISQTTAQRMEKAFVGQSFADVSATIAMARFKSIMADLKDNKKLITASDDAVEGYRNVDIRIQPPAMLVAAEVKEATGVYFVPIKFLVTEVQQSAQA